MNFKLMPELDWTFGYPYALALMALFAGALYWAFQGGRAGSRPGLAARAAEAPAVHERLPPDRGAAARTRPVGLAVSDSERSKYRDAP